MALIGQLTWIHVTGSRLFLSFFGKKSGKHFIRQETAAGGEAQDGALLFEQAFLDALVDGGLPDGDSIHTEFFAKTFEIDTPAQAQTEEETFFDCRLLGNRRDRMRGAIHVGGERVGGCEADRLVTIERKERVCIDAEAEEALAGPIFQIVARLVVLRR